MNIRNFLLFFLASLSLSSVAQSDFSIAFEAIDNITDRSYTDVPGGFSGTPFESPMNNPEFESYLTRHTAFYRKKLTLSEGYEPKFISWTVTRYSASLGNPDSSNPADWVPISRFGIDCSENLYLARVESGTSRGDLDSFSRDSFDGVKPEYSVPGALSPMVDCFYLLEVNVDGVTKTVRSDVFKALDNAFNRSVIKSYLIIDVTDDNGNPSTALAPSGKSYPYYAYQLESGDFSFFDYNLETSGVPGASTINFKSFDIEDAPDDIALRESVFSRGPVVPDRYFFEISGLQPGAASGTLFHQPWDAQNIYLKYVDYAASIGSTIPGDDGKCYWMFDTDVWASAWNKISSPHRERLANFIPSCLFYDPATGRAAKPQRARAYGGSINIEIDVDTLVIPPSPQASGLVYLFPPVYLPEAQLVDMTFSVDSDETSSVLAEEFIDEQTSSTTVYAPNKSHNLAISVTCRIPVVDDNLVTRVNGLQMRLGNKRVFIDLNSHDVGPDGLFSFTIDRVDPNTLFNPEDPENYVTLVLERTLWQTFHNVGAFSDNVNPADEYRYEIFSAHPSTISKPFAYDLSAPEINEIVLRYEEDFNSGRHTVFVDAIDVSDANNEVVSPLSDDLFLTVENSETGNRVIVDPENEFFSESFYNGENALGIAIDEHPFHEAEIDYDFRVAHAYFFSIEGQCVVGDAVTSAVVVDNANHTDADLPVYSNAAFNAMAAQNIDRKPLRAPRADNDPTPDHTVLLSPYANKVYRVTASGDIHPLDEDENQTPGPTTALDAIDAAETLFFIDGHRVVIVAEGLRVFDLAGRQIAAGVGSHELPAAPYIVKAADRAWKIILQ